MIFLLFAVIFAVTFYLYSLPLKAVLYPDLLCLFFGTVFLIADFLKTNEKYKALKRLKTFSAEMIETLPESETVCEEEYKTIIENLKNELISAKAESQTAYKDMIDYYTAWAHQIKTPIASMKLTLQNEDSELSRRLSSDLLRTQQYADMVLAFLRLGSKSSDYVFREHRLDDIIRFSVKKFAPEFIDRRLTLDYTPTDAFLITDDKWLSFVLEQLISNALKYTQSGGITISLKDKTTLLIEDTGIGINESDLPRIFEKGFTGNNGRTDKSASGLGLYLCKQICDRLSIGISITSKVGKGTAVALNFEQNPLKAE